MNIDPVIFRQYDIRGVVGKDLTPSVARAVDYLLGKRPARIVHIQSGYDGLTEAHVSARCYPDRRNQGVCFQEVHILNASDDRGMDPGSWGSLLIRDLPVFGLITDLARPVGEQIAALADSADKLIFDSAEMDQASPWHPLASMAGLAARAGTAATASSTPSAVPATSSPRRRMTTRFPSRSERRLHAGMTPRIPSERKTR